jgi:hypothetical protein
VTQLNRTDFWKPLPLRLTGTPVAQCWFMTVMTNPRGILNRLTTEQKGAAVLVVACSLLMAAGIATRTDNTSTALQPIVLGNIAQAEMVEIRDQSNVAVLSGEFRSSVDLLGNTEKDAALIDRRGRRVIGEVELEIPAKSRTDRRPELEVDILGLPPRQTFTVVVDDRVVGSFVTDDRGSVDMELQEGEMPPSVAQLGDAAFNCVVSADQPPASPTQRQ